jgi:hypothetical protein
MSSLENGTIMARNSPTPDDGSLGRDLAITGLGLAGVAVGLGLAGFMWAIGWVFGRLALLAVAAFFIGATAFVYGGISSLLRIFMPGLEGETRQIITIATVLALIVGILVIAFNTEGFRNMF